MNSETLFQLKRVSKVYGSRTDGKVFALNGVELELKRGSSYALVGESGSGKTTLGRILAGIIQPDEGDVFFDGRNLVDWLRKDRASFCRKVQFVFQNPYASLDPKWNVLEILDEGIRDMRLRERKRKVLGMLDRVCLAENFLKKKAGELSGGERQRVAIARALLMDPEFLVLDEPTSQLDVSTQAEIMKLLRDLRSVVAGGLFFIAHDIALASQIADFFIVMKSGKVVECGPRNETLFDPKASYSKKLFDSIPSWPPQF